MSKHALTLTLVAVVIAALPVLIASHAAPAAQPASPETKNLSFDNQQALAGWTITGDVTIDASKSRQGKGGSLKVGPGGKALLKLRDTDGSGKVEMWVYDDGTRPAERQGLPRRPAVGPGPARREAAGRRHPLRQLPRRQRGLHRHRLRRQGLVRPVVLARRQPQAGRLAQVDVRLRSRGGPPGPPQRQGRRRRRPRQDRPEGLQRDRHLGRQRQGRRADDLGGRRVRHAGRPGEGRRPPGEADPYDAEGRRRGHGRTTGRSSCTPRPNAPRTPKLEDLPLQGERLAVRHHLDVREAGPRRAVRQRRLVRRRAR